MRTISKLMIASVLLVAALPTYSQFYTVKKKLIAMSISTTRPEPLDSVPKEMLAQLPAEEKDSIQSDSIVTRRLFCPPLDSLVVTSPYGYRKDPFSGKRKFHYGTDFRCNSENVYAMMPGKVKKIGYNKRLGNYITLLHGEFEVTYAHLHTAVGEKGDFVEAGQSVGITGSTGRSTGEHLHVSMRFRKKSIDPYPILMYVKEHSFPAK